MRAIVALLRLPVFRRVVLVASLILGSHALHDTFSVIRWKAAGVSPPTISLLWSLSVAGEVLVFFVVGPWLLRRLTPAAAIAVAAAAGAARWFVAALTTDVIALSVIQPLHGITFALLHLACMRLLAQVVPDGLAATAQAIYGTVGVGAATAVLTLISGFLYARTGAAAFAVMGVLCLAALPIARSLRSASHLTMRLAIAEIGSTRKLCPTTAWMAFIGHLRLDGIEEADEPLMPKAAGTSSVERLSNVLGGHGLPLIQPWWTGRQGDRRGARPSCARQRWSRGQALP